MLQTVKTAIVTGVYFLRRQRSGEYANLVYQAMEMILEHPVVILHAYVQFHGIYGHGCTVRLIGNLHPVYVQHHLATVVCCCHMLPFRRDHAPGNSMPCTVVECEFEIVVRLYVEPVIKIAQSIVALVQYELPHPGYRGFDPGFHCYFVFNVKVLAVAHIQIITAPVKQQSFSIPPCCHISRSNPAPENSEIIVCGVVINPARIVPLHSPVSP